MAAVQLILNRGRDSSRPVRSSSGSGVRRVVAPLREARAGSLSARRVGELDRGHEQSSVRHASLYRCFARVAVGRHVGHDRQEIASLSRVDWRIEEEAQRVPVGPMGTVSDLELGSGRSIPACLRSEPVGSAWAKRAAPSGSSRREREEYDLQPLGEGATVEAEFQPHPTDLKPYFAAYFP